MERGFPTAMEGSRFIAWQLYRLFAGGSRERPSVWHVPGVLIDAPKNRTAVRTNAS